MTSLVCCIMTSFVQAVEGLSTRVGSPQTNHIISNMPTYKCWTYPVVSVPRNVAVKRFQVSLNTEGVHSKHSIGLHKWIRQVCGQLWLISLVNYHEIEIWTTIPRELVQLNYERQTRLVFRENWNQQFIPTNVGHIPWQAGPEINVGYIFHEGPGYTFCNGCICTYTLDIRWKWRISKFGWMESPGCYRTLDVVQMYPRPHASNN